VTGIAELDPGKKSLYHWRKDQISISLKESDETSNTKLKLTVYDMDMYSRGFSLHIYDYLLK